MAEDTPTASAPAGEPAPAEPAPETSQEKVSEKANEPEKEKSSGKVLSRYPDVFCPPLASRRRYRSFLFGTWVSHLVTSLMLIRFRQGEACF